MKIRRAIEQGATLFVAACIAAMLSSCGSGAVSSESDPTIAFSVSPSTANAFSGVPITFTLAGGGLRTPFVVTSSDQSVLPIPAASLSGTQLVITPGVVSTSQTVTLTVADQTGKQATARVTVQPNFVDGDITVTGTAPPGFPNCATAGAICAGQSGTATLTISQNGVPARGRNVRFDVVQGAFQFPTDIAQTVFANSVTATSDESGRVTVILRATAGASPQIATIRATDVTSGAFRTATFFIKQSTVSGGEFVTIPAEWKINGAITGICPGGATDFLIFGGTPPYTIRSSAPGTSFPTPSITPNENPSRFSVTYPTLPCGTDGYQVVFIVTDSSGLNISATLTVKPGTGAAPQTLTLSPSTVNLTCGQSAQIFTTITNPGTTPPTITTSTSTSTCTATAIGVSVANGVITLTRGPGLVGGTTTCPLPLATDPTPISANIIVGAGSAPPQLITINTQRYCP